ncbi:hypothetical protein GCM10022384_63420 [Streptomyces marokkonensis]|uniref:Secreted protein n=1 Tax=Streptomyces marokkonensis TaxID=324855 RepID=A0ABP7SAK6_9ACTN
MLIGALTTCLGLGTGGDLELAGSREGAELSLVLLVVTETQLGALTGRGSIHSCCRREGVAFEAQET